MSMQTSLRLTVVLALGFGCGQATAATNQKIADLLDNTSASEGEFASMLNAELASTELGGPFYSYQGGVLTLLTPSDVAQRVLANNLTIQNSKAGAELAAQALMEAEAVFDPTLTLAVGVDRSESFERIVNGTVVETVFNPQYEDPNTGLPAGPGEIILPEAVQQETGIESITFSNLQAENEVVEDADIFASQDSANGAVNALSMTATLSQQTPWGVNYSVSLGTVNKKTFYDKAGHSYDAPWASEVLLDVDVPLADFGDNSSAALSRRLNALESDRQQWVVKEQINALLKTASETYLALIESSQKLLIQQRLYLQTQEQYSSTKKRFDRRTATSYELSQIESELNLRRTEVTIAANNYLASSNTLLSLISDNTEIMQGRVVVPSAYSAWLGSTYEIDTQNALQLSIDNRAVLHDSKLQVELADSSYQNAVLKTRPDVVFSAGMALQQNGSVVGYDSLGSSLSNAFSPDSNTQKLGLTYTYPFKNTQRKAQREIASIQVSDSKLAAELSQRTVEHEVSEALNQLDTAKRLKEQVLNSFHASSRSWESLQRLDRNGGANQNQIINGLRALQTAELGVLNANLNIKRAELEVLAAVGTLSQSFASWTARNEFEVQRIAWLSKQADLQYFGKQTQ